MPEDDPDRDQDGGHPSLGLFAGIALIFSSAAPFLRSCDDAALLFSKADDVSYAGQYVDDIGRISRAGRSAHVADDLIHLQPSGSVASNDKIARYAMSEPVDFERYTADIGRQAVTLAEAKNDQLSRIMFETRRFEPRMQLLYAAPRDGDEFSRIFDRTATVSELAMVTKATKRLSGLSRSRRTESAMDVLNVIDGDEGSVVVIVGHNDSGKLRLADGSEIDITLMAQHCDAAGKLCVILSCNSNRFLDAGRPTRGVDDTLTYDDAGRIGEEINAVFAKLSAEGGRGLRAKNLLKANQIDALVKLSLERGLARNRLTKRVRQSGKLVSFGTGGGMIVYQQPSVESDR